MKRYPENIDKLEDLFRKEFEHAEEECDDRLWDKLNQSLEDSKIATNNTKINKLENIIKLSLTTNVVLILLFGAHIIMSHQEYFSSTNSEQTDGVIPQKSEINEDATEDIQHNSGSGGAGFNPVSDPEKSGNKKSPLSKGASDKQVLRNGQPGIPVSESTITPATDPDPVKSPPATDQQEVKSEVAEVKHPEPAPQQDKKAAKDFYQKHYEKLKAEGTGKSTADTTEKKLFIPK